MKPRKHAEVIKAWADGAEIQYRYPNWSEGHWKPAAYSPMWDEDAEYRVKPEREYPHTSIHGDVLYDIFYQEGDARASLIRVADAAIKQYILDLEKEHK